jgi:flagellar basal-body rod protein FlgB
MDLTKIPFFELINRRLAWLSQRQDVLAENVANVNTPGYKARDLKEPSFAELLRGPEASARLAVTRPNHLGGAIGQAAYKPIADTSATPTIDGNAVDIESEMMKVSKTGIDYQFAISLYKKQIGMIKTALGR